MHQKAKHKSPLELILKLAIYTACFSLILFFFSTNRIEKNDRLYQISSINALLEGAYDGILSLKELKKHGDFGHGTLDKLDGELAILDGEAFQIKHDGSVYKVSNEAKTPYANLVFFQEDLNVNLNSLISFTDLKKSISSLIESKNNPHAIKVTGLFKSLKLRSVPAQSKPYKNLSSIIKDQNIFVLENIEGTMLGFWLPEYFKNMNVPGYHFHFISSDRQAGGHVLDAGEMENLTISIDKKKAFRIDFNNSRSLNNANLSKDRDQELNKVEKNG